MDWLKLLWLDQLLENTLISSSLRVSTPTPTSCTSTAIHTPSGGIWPPTPSTHPTSPLHQHPCHSHAAPCMNSPRSALGLRCFRSLRVFSLPCSSSFSLIIIIILISKKMRCCLCPSLSLSRSLSGKKYGGSIITTYRTNYMLAHIPVATQGTAAVKKALFP